VVEDPSESKVMVVALGSGVQIPALPQFTPPKVKLMGVAVSGSSVPAHNNPSAFIPKRIDMTS